MALAALDRILRDESIHRAFGWDTLDELLEILGEPAIHLVRQRIPDYVERLRDAYSWPETSPSSCTDEELRWGRMEPHRYQEITERCIADVILPRFESRVGPLA